MRGRTVALGLIIGLATAILLSACGSGGGSYRRVHYGVGFGGGPWYGYPGYGYGGPVVVVPPDIPPDVPDMDFPEAVPFDDCCEE